MIGKHPDEIGADDKVGVETRIDGDGIGAVVQRPPRVAGARGLTVGGGDVQVGIACASRGDDVKEKWEEGGRMSTSKNQNSVKQNAEQDQDQSHKDSSKEGNHPTPTRGAINDI